MKKTLNIFLCLGLFLSCNSSKGELNLSDPINYTENILAELYVCYKNKKLSCNKNGCSKTIYLPITSVPILNTDKVIVKLPDDPNKYCKDIPDINIISQVTAATLTFDAKIVTTDQGEISYVIYKNGYEIFDGTQKNITSIDNLSIQVDFEPNDTFNLAFRVDGITDDFNYKITSFSDESEQAKITLIEN